MHWGRVYIAKKYTQIQVNRFAVTPYRQNFVPNERAVIYLFSLKHLRNFVLSGD